MWKRWKEWLPEVLFIVIILGVAFFGALHAYLNQ